MGMFDELHCDAPLPDGFDASGATFQTKSFPDAGLCKYRITADGRLLDAWNRDCEPDGYINFYTHDEHADPEQADEFWRHWREYRARFRDGRLETIERLTKEQLEAEPRRHYGLASFRWFAPLAQRCEASSES